MNRTMIYTMIHAMIHMVNLSAANLVPTTVKRTRREYDATGYVTRRCHRYFRPNVTPFTQCCF